MDRPGGNRALDKQVAAIIGWTELVEIRGHLDLVGKPPGSDKVEPVPFYSSVGWLAARVVEAFVAQGGTLEGELPPEPWNVCERVIAAHGRNNTSK